MASLAAFFFTFKTVYIPLMVFHYLWFGLASSLYFHRCLTHRAFELAKPLHFFFMLGGLIGLGGDPVQWAGIHRYHHSHSDIPEDSHSPREGFLYAYVLWHMRMDMKQVEEWTKFADDLKQLRYVRWARGLGPSTVLHGAYVVFIFSQFGLPGLLYGFYLPLALSYQFCWMLIASLCHMEKFGSRRADTPDTSRNIWWLAPVSFGESFHNNHHESPRRFRHGLRWYDIDFTSWVVICLEKLGLAKSVVR
jgi:fatty-acid desaturase